MFSHKKKKRMKTFIFLIRLICLIHYFLKHNITIESQYLSNKHYFFKGEHAVWDIGCYFYKTCMNVKADYSVQLEPNWKLFCFFLVSSRRRRRKLSDLNVRSTARQTEANTKVRGFQCKTKVNSHVDLYHTTPWWPWHRHTFQDVFFPHFVRESEIVVWFSVRGAFVPCYKKWSN